MLIFIICAVIALVGIIWLIVNTHICKSLDNNRPEHPPISYYDKAETAEGCLIASIAISSIFIFVTGVMGIVIGSVKNPNLLANKEDEIRLRQEILELNNTYSTLQATDVNDAIARSEVNIYNEKVRDFKTKVETHQLRLNNPWTNWFEKYYWNNVNVDDVQYFVINK